MKTTEELLYQIRGLARIAIIFCLLYQGIVPKWLMHDPATLHLLAAQPFAIAHPNWIIHGEGIVEIGLAAWLAIGFADIRPLWLVYALLGLVLLDTMIFSPITLGTAFNVTTISACLFALTFIDMSILRHRSPKSAKLGHYMRFSRDRVIYEATKRLELNDLPHIMHAITRSRWRRMKNRKRNPPLVRGGKKAGNGMVPPEDNASNLK